MIDAIREFFDTYLRGSWTSILDIGLVAFVIYWLFILIRGTRAVRIVIGLSILYLVYLSALFFGFDLLRRLMETAALAGLFAARRLAHSMGGQLTVEPRLPRGSQFVLELAAVESTA